MRVPANIERITLLCQESSTASSIPRSLGRKASALMVSGLEFGDDLLLHPMYGIKPVHERELALPAPMISRLAAFYETHLTKGPDRSPSWNCHSFAVAMMGWEIENTERDLQALSAGQKIASTALRHGLPYVVSDQEEVLHSMIGIDPQDCLGVVGRNRPLKILSVEDSVSLWGDSLHEAARR